MRNKLFLIVLIAVLYRSPAWSIAIGQASDPLAVGGGARPIGMGRAFGAVADDSDAIFINPAGSALIKRPQAMTMFTSLLGGEIYYSEYCGTVPASFGSVSIGYISTGVNSISTIVNSQEVLADYYDSVLAFSYASSLARFFRYADNVFAGLSLKLFNRGFTGGLNDGSSGFSADFGLKFVLSPYFNLGLTRQNFVPFSLGAGLRTSGGLQEALAGGTKLSMSAKPMLFNGQLLLAGDINVPSLSSEPVTNHLGAEWKVSPNVSVRSGLDQGLDSDAPGGASWNPTYGLSFTYGGFRMDYAFHPYYNNPALATSYFSFSYSGDPWLALEGRVE